MSTPRSTARSGRRGPTASTATATRSAWRCGGACPGGGPPPPPPARPLRAADASCSLEVGPGLPGLLDVGQGVAELADPLALVAVDETHAPRQGLAAAAGDAGVDERVEHGALGVAQPRHHGHRQMGEQVALAVDLHAPGHLAAEPVLG